MATENTELHVVMFPWLAFGHLIPFLELAKLIAQKGHRVSVVSTPRNIDRLPKLPPNLVPYIEFVRFPLPKLDDLPENAESTSDVPYSMVPILKKAYDGLQEPLKQFLRSSDPDWILSDFASYWMGEVAEELGIKTAFFCIFSASCTGFMGPPAEVLSANPSRTQIEDFTVSPNWVPFPSTVRCRYFEMWRSLKMINDKDSGVSDFYRMGRTIQNCDIVAIRSCFEFEPEWLQLTGTIYKKPVIPVGELPTTAYDNGEDDNQIWRWMRDWLDKKEKGTVVYIAFGSEAKLNQEELNHLALGLEKSKLPFFWVLRTRRGEHDLEVLKLPEGFEERTKGHGLVWTGWVPQLKIIAHEAIGVLLCHSGWSSVVEAIQFEKSLVLLPLLADHGLHARLLEEKKIAYSIPRNEMDGSFSCEDVADSLRLVVLEERGKIYREKIKEMKGLFANEEKQDSYITNFLKYLIVNRNPRKSATNDTFKQRCPSGKP